MLIEIGEKEKTALSLLLGLRQKFALEKKGGVTYSAMELHKLFSELIQKINKGELRYLDTITITYGSERGQGKVNKVWDHIDEQIEKSTIKRYEWKKVFGNSLTEEILKLKKSGVDVDNAFANLSGDDRVIKFLNENEIDAKDIIKNLKTSVHARYGENNTAMKVMSDDELMESLPQ